MLKIKSCIKTYLIFSLIFFLACNSNEDEDNIPSNEPTNSIPENGLTTNTSTSDSEGYTYEIGFNQVNSINQDPYVLKRDSNGETIWYIEHETSEVDGRAILVFVDNQDVPWVVFTLVGGSYSNDYLTKKELANTNAFENVYAGSYGNGGGAKVSIVTRLDPNTGKIVKGSFILARKNDGDTNSFSIKSIGIIEGKLAFTAHTAAWPPGQGNSYSRYPNITDADRVGNAFVMYYEMTTDLKMITKAALYSE